MTERQSRISQVGLVKGIVAQADHKHFLPGTTFQDIISLTPAVAIGRVEVVGGIHGAIN